MLYLCRTLRILVIGLWDLLFSLFQLLPVDQARTRQWHLHLRIQWCHSQVRMARFICMTFLISLSLIKHWNIDISLTLTLHFFPTDSLQSVERVDSWFMWRKSMMRIILNLWLGQPQKMSEVFPALTQKGPCPCSQGNPGTVCFMVKHWISTFCMKHKTTRYCRYSYFYVLDLLIHCNKAFA